MWNRQEHRIPPLAQRCLCCWLGSLGAQASKVYGAAAAPYGWSRLSAKNAPSHRLPGIINAIRYAKSGQVSKADDVTATPFRGLMGGAKHTRSYNLADVVDPGSVALGESW